ncbi:MAG TPA: IPT/TIG domain-containing protein [Polyangia bacterium]|nr:IPT/TIG domain-containing protein [Polyangia bacterium]
MRAIRTLFAGMFILGLSACSNELKVSEIDPPNGTFSGGEEVVIKGNGFQPGRGGVTVKFGKKDAQAVVVESSDKIKVTTPGGDKNTTVDVSVVFDDGKAFQIKNGFHFIDTSQQRATMDKAFNAFGGDKKDEKK